MTARRIMCVTGRRAEFGLARSVFEGIQAHPGSELQLLVTADHLLPEFGDTARLVEESGLPVAGTVRAAPSDDTRSAMAKVVGEQVLGIREQVEALHPDILLALTDLGHALATAIVGQYMGIPVAHLHGGDVSGNVDDAVRHAVTKLSHLHFAVSAVSAERIVRLGEEPWRVHVTGAPGLDSILHAELPPRGRTEELVGLAVGEEYLLLLMHPESEDAEGAGERMRLVIDAALSSGLPLAVVYPNADAGGRAVIAAIESYAGDERVRAFPNLVREDFLAIMRDASAMVGNSSSGILEAPSFKVPVVNIGDRQLGRERACNVIDVPFDAGAIAAGIARVLRDADYRSALERCDSPYGDGHAGERIVGLLVDTPIDERLLLKRMTY